MRRFFVVLQPINPLKQPHNSTFSCILAAKSEPLRMLGRSIAPLIKNTAQDVRTFLQFCSCSNMNRVWVKPHGGCISVKLRRGNICACSFPLIFLSLYLFFFWVTVWGRQDGIHTPYWALDKGMFLPLGTWIKIDMIMQEKSKVRGGLWAWKKNTK